jgi:hypothetical protein
VQGAWRGVTMAAVMLLSGLATGCDKVTGGGWINSSVVTSAERATFGFTARCKNTTVDSTPTAVLYEGQLEYYDRGAGIRIHGDVEPNEFAQAPGMTCKEVGRSLEDPPGPFVSATLHGTYRTQPGGLQGEFEVLVTDNGEPGALNGDTFDIKLTGAVMHVNAGPIQGGNIQVG